jgi:uncharacterized protein YkwD
MLFATPLRPNTTPVPGICIPPSESEPNNDIKVLLSRARREAPNFTYVAFCGILTGMKLRYKVSVALLGLLVVSAVIMIITSAQAKLTTPVVAPETISTYAIYNDVNAARRAANVPTLSLNPLATQAAKEKCQDMVTNDYYAHINPKTGLHGYAYAENLIPSGKYFNENLNEGYSPTNQGWVDSWLNSLDHKTTMLDPSYTDTGLAICHRPSSSAGTITVVQEFISIPAAT